MHKEQPKTPGTIFAVTAIAQGMKARGWDGPSGSDEYRRDREEVTAEVREKHPGDFWAGGQGRAPW